MPHPVVHEHHYHYHDNRNAINVNAEFGGQGGGHLRVRGDGLPLEEHPDSDREQQRLIDRVHRHIREDEEAFGAIRELPSYPMSFERSGRLIQDVSSHRSKGSHSERAHSAAGSQHSHAEQGVQQVVVRGPDGIPRIASVAPSRAASVRSSGSRAREAPAPVTPSRAVSVRSSGSRAREAPASVAPSRAASVRSSGTGAREAPAPVAPSRAASVRSSGTGAREAPAPVAPSRAGSVRSSGSRTPTLRPSDSQTRHAPSRSGSTSRHPTLLDAEVRPEDSVSQAPSRASRASSAAPSHAPSVARALSSHSQSHSHHTSSHAGGSHENQYYRDPANPNVRYHSSAHSRPGR